MFSSTLQIGIMHLTNNRGATICRPTGQPQKLLPLRGLAASGLLRPVVRDRDEHRSLECFLWGKITLQRVALAGHWLLFCVWHNSISFTDIHSLRSQCSRVHWKLSDQWQSCLPIRWSFSNSGAAVSTPDGKPETMSLTQFSLFGFSLRAVWPLDCSFSKNSEWVNGKSGKTGL